MPGISRVVDDQLSSRNDPHTSWPCLAGSQECLTKFHVHHDVVKMFGSSSLPDTPHLTQSTLSVSLTLTRPSPPPQARLSSPSSHPNPFATHPTLPAASATHLVLVDPVREKVQHPEIEEVSPDVGQRRERVLKHEAQRRPLLPAPRLRRELRRHSAAQRPAAEPHL